jgi:hypothetical protein
METQAMRRAVTCLIVGYALLVLAVHLQMAPFSEHGVG